jgi:5'(3')-deoxyribonucleotidase
MSKRTIAVDFDDVIFDFAGGFLKFCRDTYGQTIAYENIHSFYLEDVWQISKEEANNRIKIYYNSAYHHNAEPVAGTVQALTELQNNFEIKIITNSPADTHEQMLRWLKKYGLDFINEIFHTRKNVFDTHTLSKFDVAQTLGAEYIIDDAQHVVELFAGSHIVPILLSKPWNKQYEDVRVKRAGDWGEVLKLIT